MPKKQKLELTWIGKDKRPKLEPRILIEDPDKSYHAKERVSENDIFDNMLIHGDNLLALKALQQDYAGEVKCVFIDPPYNTGSAFEKYDDGIEHSLWLALMRERLAILKSLLHDEGFICVQIDDNEGAYLKVLLDEVFGRNNYLTTLYIQVRYGNKTLAEDNDYQKVIEQCHIYAKNSKLAKANKEKEPYKVEKFQWEITELTDGEKFEAGGKKIKLFKPGEYELKKVEPHLKALKETWATGSLVRQTGSSGEFLNTHLIPRKEKDGLSCLYKVQGIGEDGLGHRYMTGPKKATATKGKFFSGIPLKTLAKIKSGDSDKSLPIQNYFDLAGSFGNCRHEGKAVFGGGKKPEALLQLILKHFSNQGDLVLDSFLGSGTTAAVAHKMNRRWIGIELGDQCSELCSPRLRDVIDGEDKSGVTTELSWKGGGGFRYYELGPSLIEEDKWGNPIISKEFDPTKLAQAMCKLEGFDYAPDPDTYWMQGRSSETDFIFVTSQTMTKAALAKLSDEVGPDRSLLVCCPSFRAKETDFPNLTLKKIPKAVLKKCEWGRDDYSLQIQELPPAPPEEDTEEVKPKKPRRKFGKDNPNQKELF